MNQKIILIFLIFFLTVAFSWLAYSEKNQHQIVGQWFLYFNNPQDNSLDFTIENHSDKSEFEWQLVNDDRTTEKQKIKVLKEERKTVKIEKNFKGLNKIMVKQDNKSEKSIYKILQ